MSEIDRLCKEVDDIHDLRRPLESTWKVNRAFYAGNQYTYVNSRSGRIERLGTGPTEKPHWRVRITDNQVTKNTHARVAQLVKSKPVFYPTPSDTDIDSQHAAAVGEGLMTHFWHQFRMTKLLWDVLLQSCISGGYWWIMPDPQAGEPTEYMVDPERGQPILEYGLRQLFEAELASMGLPPDVMKQTLYPGDISVKVLGAEEVLIDPSARNWEDAKYVIVECGMKPEDVKAKWPSAGDVTPDATPGGSEAIPLNYAKTPVGAPAKDKTLKKVYYKYYRPCAEMPKGKITIFIKTDGKEGKDGRGKILETRPWDLPFRSFPLVKFPGIPVPGSPYDATVIEMAVPLQRELNRTQSQIMEYKNLTVAPQWKVPVGSLRTQLTNEPGLGIEYSPINGAVPEPVVQPALPPYLVQLVDIITDRIQGQFGLHKVQQGELPPNVESGIGIDLLQEMSTHELAPLISMIEMRIEEAGSMMLSIAANMYEPWRIESIVGTNLRPKVQAFLQQKNNMATGHVVRVEAGSMMPRTRAGRQARILELIKNNIMDPIDGLKFLDLADFAGMRARLEADEGQAIREHERLLKKQPLNPMAYAQAQGQLQMAVMAGQLPPEQAMQMLQEASLSPTASENSQAHLMQHVMYMKSVDFESLPPDVQMMFEQHVQLTKQKIASEAPQPEGEAPRVNVQARGAVTPSVMEAILAKAGVQVEPGIMSQEEPMETVVFDSTDKVDETPEDAAIRTMQNLAELELTEAKTKTELAKARQAANPPTNQQTTQSRPRNG
jgi:hypothetical protein